MEEFFINGRFLTKPITGVGRFALEICKSLQEEGIEFTLLVPKIYKDKLDNPFGFNIKYLGSSNSHIWEQLFLWIFMLKKSNALLVNFSGLGPVLVKNKIITIHDLSFFHRPQWFSKGYYYFYRIFTPLAARWSQNIITVSEFSKSEILKYLKIDKDKITVVYNGNSFTNSNSQNVEAPNRKFILGVSSLDPRKNHRLLLRAFERIKDQFDMDLILVGKSDKHFNFKLGDGIKLDRVRFTGYVSDEELQNLYQNASLFVYPSLYEGFGIPPLEAIFHGCPILISDIPVFHEVFRDAAVYFDPLSEESLVAALKCCLNEGKGICVNKRAKILERYSWKKSANRIMKLLKNENFTAC